MSKTKDVDFQISLKSARVNAGMTQNDVAKELKISKGTIVKWESYETSPNAKILVQLAQLYKCPIDRMKLL